MFVYLYVYCFSFRDHVSKPLTGESSPYTRNKDYIKPVFHLSTSLVGPDPQKKRGSGETVYKKFSVRNFDDVYRLPRCYANIDSAGSAWSNKNFISTVLIPTQQKWLILVSTFATVILAINLLEVISTSHDSFDRPSVTSSNLKWSDLIGAAQILAAPNFFYTVLPDPFFEGLVLWDYLSIGKLLLKGGFLSGLKTVQSETLHISNQAFLVLFDN